MIKQTKTKFFCLLTAMLLQYNNSHAQCNVAINASGDLESNPSGVSLWATGANGVSWINKTTGQTFTGNTIWANTPGLYVVNATDYSNPSKTCTNSFELGNQRGLQFNGINKVVMIPINSKLARGTGNYTIEFVVKSSTVLSTDPRKSEVLISNSNTNSSDYFELYMNRSTQTGGDDFFSFNSGSGQVTASKNIRDGKCHHIAVTKNATATYFYIDGILLGQGNPSSFGGNAGNTTSPWFIGGSNLNFMQYTNFGNGFNGFIKQVRLWNKTLSQSQVQQYMNTAMLPASEAGLVANYQMNETSGQVVNDRSVNPVNGYLGSTNLSDTFDPARANIGCGSAPIPTPALNYNGSNQVSFIPAHPKLAIGTGAFTVEMIIKPTSNIATVPGNSGEVLISNNNTNTSNHLQVAFYRATCATCTDNVELNAGGAAIYASANLRDNKCHHIAFTKTATTTTLYIDGVIAQQQPNDPFRTNGVGNGDQPWLLGGANTLWQNYSSFVNVFNGMMKEVRVWNVARTASQIQSNINRGLAGNESGLVAYWPLNEGAGQIIKDIALNTSPAHGSLGVTSTNTNNDPAWILNNCAPVGPVLRESSNASPSADLNLETISAYPNPFNNELNFKVNFSLEENYSLEVINNLGTVLHKVENLKPGIDYSLKENLPSGSYILKVNNGSIVKTKLITKE